MMKYPFHSVSLFAVLLAILVNLFAAVDSEARIGERRQSIESRLFDSGGIVYRDETIKAARRRGMPYMRFMELLPNSLDARIYFKTDDGRRPASSELNAQRMSTGWDLHVIYVDGKSVIEVYKRSQSMTGYEFNQLLAVHAEGSFWKRLNGEERQELDSAFAVDMIRDDGLVRARKIGGDTVIFIDSDFDVTLAELRDADLQERAPVSVNGF